MATINGTAGNDDLRAPGSDDELLGLEGNDTLDAVLTGKGNNTLRGGGGNDELFAYTEDQLFGDGGNDELFSDGKGKNLLDGGEGDDEIFPDVNDTVNGGAGDDIIFAGRGGNTFTGGSGKDVFWIANVEEPENPNVITDFNFIEETIRVDLAGVESFDDLSITQEGNDTIINAGGSQIAIVQGVAPNKLNETNVVTDNNAPDNSRINQSPSFNFDVATISITENSAQGTSIGIFSADDEDEDDILTYAITDGNLDVDGDGNNAFSIDENSGNLLVNDSDDLDFEKNPNFNLSVSVTDNTGDSDTANIAINLQDEFDEPPSVEDATFSVSENSAEGTLIGTLEASDNDKDDVLTYAITAGNLDVDGDGNNAFSINANGEIIVNDSDDLDFETNPNFNLSVTATDSGQLSDTANITINLQDIIVEDTETPGVIGISDGTKLKFTVNTVNANTTVNELVVFDYDGTTPNLQQLLLNGKAQTISSIVSNEPLGFSASDISRILEFNSGQFGFALIKNGSADDVKNGQSKEIVYSNENNFISNISDSSFELNIEGFNIQVANTSEEPAIGSGLQTGNEGELLDFRQAGELSGVDKVEVTFTMYREAAFDNEVVFYKVQDADGRIGDSLLDPNSTLPSDYLNAALDNLVTDMNGDVIKLEVENQGQASVTIEVETGSIFAPMIIVDGNLEQLQDDTTINDPTVYFPYIGANSDGADHIRLLGNNVFGFEDLPDGGDLDYQDIIVKTQVNTQPTISV